MIKLSILARKIEEKLDVAGRAYGCKFKIATETGDFEKSIKNINEVTEYINGIIEAGNSSVTNLISGDNSPGILYATQTCYLKFVVKLEDEEQDTQYGDDIFYGNKHKLESIRNVLNNVFEQNSLEVIDDGSKSYAVTTVFSLEQTGERAQLPIVGDCMTFTAEAYFMFVENGINTRNFTFLLDGIIIPYQTVTSYRTPTMDGNVYSNTIDGATKNLVSQTTLSISFELPALTDEITEKMIAYILESNANSHILTVKINNREKTYLVQFGEVKNIGETIKNVGQTLSLMESPDIYDLISFDSNLYIYEVIKELDDVNSLQYWVFDNENKEKIQVGAKIVSASRIDDAEHLATIQG